MITDWHEWGLELYLNFSNPLAISTGTTKDRIIVKIIDRSLFESLDGKEVLMSDRVYLQKDIPKQLPLGVEEE